MENLSEFQIPEEAREKLRDPDVLRRHVEEGSSFQDIIGYSSETMEKFYGAAYGLFQRQSYQEAADAFVFLTTLNPFVHNYWLGLGMCEQLNQEYEAALVAYAMAALTDLSNPVPHYHSATCYQMLNDYPSALSALELVVQNCGDDEQHVGLKQQALTVSEKLSKRKRN